MDNKMLRISVVSFICLLHKYVMSFAIINNIL